MNSPEPTTSHDAVIQELVAYLDGELDAGTSARIEQRLAEDAGYRHQLQQLQRTWDLLDELPRTSSDERFTQTTVEMVALKAADAGKLQKSARRARSNVFWAAAVALILAASIGGYLLGQRVADSKNRQVLKDLPVIENVDLYSNADSIEFLLSLDEEGLFTEEPQPTTEAEADDVQ